MLLGFPTKFAKLSRKWRDFRQKWSRISMYFRPHFRENFRIKKKMINFDIYRTFYSISHQEEWLSARPPIGWWGKCIFFLKNIFPSANILGDPNYMNRMTAIYLNLIYNAIMYSMTEYFSCIYWGQRIILQ